LGGWQRIYVSSWEFLILFGASIWTIAAFAEKPTMPVIGFVNAASPQGYARPFSAFLKGLGETGYVEGRNVAIECRWAEGHNDRLPAMIADLIHRQVTMIAATTTPAALAAKAATATIPIVFETAGDPIQLGLVPPRRQYHGRDTARRGHSAKAATIVARAGSHGECDGPSHQFGRSSTCRDRIERGALGGARVWTFTSSTPAPRVTSIGSS
jgi:hypothetical protein